MTATRPNEEADLLDFVDTASIGLHRVAADGTILWANEADYAPLGYSREEYVGHEITKFHADADVIADILRRLRAGERLHDYEARLRAKDGSIRHVRITSSVKFGDEGEFVHTRCFTRDVTEAKKTEDALHRALAEREIALRKAEEAIRARDVFLAVAAHELRTPLTPLRLQVERLLRIAEKGESTKESVGRAAEDLGIAHRQVHRLERLVNNLLDVSRLSSGQVEIELADTDLVSVTRAVIERQGPEASRLGVAIDVAPHDPIVGLWDGSRVDQVVANVVGNAIKYGAGKPVSVTFAAVDHTASVTVRDRGPGIPEGAQARIFDRFERAGSEQHQGGLGLGLWIAREIVALLGGAIAVESRPGHGATFTITLPIRGRRADG